MKVELRVQDTELRANEDGSMTVSGYVNMTEQPSEILGQAKKFIEKIAKGAFSRAITNAKNDIDFLAEHNRNLILASTRNKSLELVEDENGLFMTAVITQTSWGRDYYELIKSGILRNMSFGFRTVKDDWKLVKPNLYERVIQELELFEVSVVKDPAYSQSTIAARGIDVIEDVTIPDELLEENRNMEDMKKAISDLTEKFDSLVSIIEEMRSNQNTEIEAKEIETEVKSIAVEVETEIETIETKVEEATEEEVEETTEVEVEEEVETETEEMADEMSEDSETSTTEEEEVEEIKVDTDSNEDVTAEIANLRSRLDALK